MKMMTKGLIMIYWGYGKGKTSAAMGLALRALGHGLRVLIVQFMKGGGKEGWKTGEEIFFEELARLIRLRRMGRVEFQAAGKGWVRILGDKKKIEDHEQAARKGLAFARDQVSGGRFQVVILDEILSAVDSALLTVEDVKKLIRAKPPAVHLLMTGHKEYPELTKLADLVTRMEKIKHPYDKGIKAQKGVDF